MFTHLRFPGKWLVFVFIFITAGSFLYSSQPDPPGSIILKQKKFKGVLKKTNKLEFPIAINTQRAYTKGQLEVVLCKLDEYGTIGKKQTVFTKSIGSMGNRILPLY